MTRHIRLAVALAAALALLPGVAVIIAYLPAFGAHALPYGDAINHAAPLERHVTNIVTAVNFDYRGIDTLGEEYMLIAAVVGVVVLLRGRRGESLTDAPAPVAGRRTLPPSDAIVLVCRFLAPVVLLFGIYVVAHAQLTPGGGFQGGVILSSGTLLIYLGEGYHTWRRLVLSWVVDAVEALGALIFVGAGLAPMLGGAAFLQNVLPLGHVRALISGGLILVVNLGVALAVAAGFTLVIMEFLEETRVAKPEDEA